MPIEIRGTRAYVTGDTYPIRDRLKAVGCHWDSESRLWWIGKAKADAVAEIVTAHESKPQEPQAYQQPTPQELERLPCAGKATYKGKQYYVVGQSDRTGKLHLTNLACSLSFWADASACQWLKRYNSVSRFQGRGMGSVEQSQTVLSIRRFIDKATQDEKAIKSGEIPAGYCVDLEDGLIKRRSECDIPSD
jgi:hypothetical protein